MRMAGNTHGWRIRHVRPANTPTGAVEASARDRLRGQACAEHAAPEESALQRALPVQAPTAEPRRLPRGIEPRNRLAVPAQHTALQVGLDPPEALARHRLKAD